jgi:hypothetical protein
MRPPAAKKKRLETAEKVEKEGVQLLVRTMLPGLIGKTTFSSKPIIKQLVGKWILDALPRAVAGAQKTMARRQGQNNLLAKIKVPVLVLAGSEDTLFLWRKLNPWPAPLKTAKSKLLTRRVT